jgi:hypothetical protein
MRVKSLPFFSLRTQRLCYLRFAGPALMNFFGLFALQKAILRRASRRSCPSCYFFFLCVLCG